jgi:hypothetical protein
MRKLIGWPTSWALYWIGHVVSFSVERFDRGYPLYNWCMGRSLMVNDWAALKIWVPESTPQRFSDGGK